MRLLKFLGVLLAVSVGALTWGPEQEERAKRLRFTASNDWALNHFCASIGRLTSALPELQGVRIELENLDILTPSSVASLRSALAQLNARGVQVSIWGCAPSLARQLRRLGFPVEPEVPSSRGTSSAEVLS